MYSSLLRLLGQVNTGNWKNDKKNGRCIMEDLRNGSWIDYNWVDGGPSAGGKRKIRLAFPDDTVYEGV